MKGIIINAKRDGYDTDQCGHTLTVGELIGILEQFEEDVPVFISNDGGYTFGSITTGDLEEINDTEEEEE